MPSDPVMHAIYENQIARIQAKKENKAKKGQADQPQANMAMNPAPGMADSDNSIRPLLRNQAASNRCSERERYERQRFRSGRPAIQSGCN